LTEANFDKTLILKEIISKLDSDLSRASLNLLGEMQYAFISFVMGENLESFDQWKKLFCLLCHCGTGLSDPNLSKDLFMKFIPVIYEQLRQLPKDFFSDDLSKVSFINDSLNALYENANDDKVCKPLRLRVEKLKGMLLKEYDFRPKQTIE
jgi:A1 cistron-splicing factor AAR2